MAIRIGISGWLYGGWRGVFYPPDLPHRRELAWAAQRFASIEINGSFYSLQRASSWRRWRDETPAGFVFAVKGSRFVTHMKRLRDAESALANFFASGLLRLDGKLGPILWQLPERFRYDEERFEEFFRVLPRTTREAARLAARHDQRVRDPDPRGGRNRRLRHALEVRHESFLDAACARQLARHGVALVVSHSAGAYPLVEQVTAPFLYLRLHGATEMYSGSYADRELDSWAERIASWAAGNTPASAATIPGARRRRPHPSGRDVYVYFDNDQKVRAPFDALRLAERLRRLGAPLVEPARSEDPRSSG